MSRPPRVLTVCRFKFNPLDPFDVTAVEQMFFLCRASLSHAKLGTYVEQYQGMTTLTRSVAFGSCVAATYYASWIISSVLAHVAQGGHTVWPMLTLAVAIVFADGVSAALARGRYPPPRIDLSPLVVSYASAFAETTADRLSRGTSVCNGPMRRSCGHTARTIATTISVARPPPTTDRVGPTKAAVAPLSNAPNSFEKPMNT